MAGAGAKAAIAFAAPRAQLFLASEAFYGAESSAFGYSRAAVMGKPPPVSVQAANDIAHLGAQVYELSGYQKAVLASGIPQNEGVCHQVAEWGAKHFGTDLVKMDLVKMLPPPRTIGFLSWSDEAWKFHAAFRTPAGLIVDLDQQGIFFSERAWAAASAKPGVSVRVLEHALDENWWSAKTRW